MKSKFKKQIQKIINKNLMQSKVLTDRDNNNKFSHLKLRYINKKTLLLISTKAILYLSHKMTQPRF